MKLLICTSEYYPNGSGIANVAYNIVEQLKRNNDVDCTICSPTGPDIKLGSYKLINKYGILGLLFYWYHVSTYFKSKNSNYDVVWCHNPLFLYKNPFDNCLITIHSTYLGELSRGVSNPYIRMYKRVASIIEKHCILNLKTNVVFTGVSPSICDELEKIGVDTQKISYVSNGVDTHLFKPSTYKREIRKKYGIPLNDLVLLSLGRLTEVKNPLKLIDVFSLLEKRIKNLTLVVAGDGELLDSVKTYTANKKIYNVIFLGHLDHKTEVPEIYACSDFYIICSDYEGQPLTLLEAMSSGLTCIVSNIPNLKFVEDLQCGTVVDFSDISKAVDKIIDCFTRDNLEYTLNSRKYAEENLDWHIIADVYYTKLNSLIS